LDLEPIRDLPIESVVPLLQPWPDSTLKYSTGGIWGPPAAAAQAGPSAAGGATPPAGANPALFATQGPPSAK
jgi:hypothetical protein